MKKGILLVAVTMCVACGGKNNDNNTSNNTTSNNTTSNNTTANNTTANNTTANNTTANNTTNTTNTNNTVANPYMLMGECGNFDYDQNGDGTTDAVQLQELDAAGGENFTALVTDLGGDGTTDWAQRSTWDADGNELTRDEDRDGDGMYDRHVEWTYTSDGQLSELHVDEGATMDAFTIIQTFDANGNLLTSVQDGTFDAMGNLTPADGTPDATQTRTYNGENLATLELDSDGDGTFEVTVTNTFDANGNVTHSERDGYTDDTGAVGRAADGTPDSTWDYTYDAMDRVATLQQDGDVGAAVEQADGTMDRIEQNYTYDADGNPLSYEFDGNLSADGSHIGVVADGTFDLITFTYDADGNQDSITVDQGNDGSDEFVLTRTFDSDGQVLTVTRDGEIDNENALVTPADGTMDWDETLTWQGVGMPLTRNVDVDGDGTDDVIETWGWDANGNQTSHTLDGELDLNELVTAADGTLDQDITIEYDAMDRMTSYVELRDGAQAQAATWTYGMCTDFL